MKHNHHDPHSHDHHPHHPKILILLRKGNYTSGGGYSQGNLPKAGLFNSANFLKEALIRDLKLDTILEIADDGNDIDRRLSKKGFTHCILEALWVTPIKLKELVKLYPKVIFIIRIHSKIPFLANEGIAIDWIKEYNKLGKTVVISYNNQETFNDFKNAGLRSEYLPNIYKYVECIGDTISLFDKLKSKLIEYGVIGKDNSKKDLVNIGCFGAIRPLKNQLFQAFAAMQFAEKHGKVLNFHINATRVEQKGDEVLKNMRALFKGTRHNLVEWDWLTHSQFLDVIKAMDLGLQLSFTESFNIVTADFVYQEVPIVVSQDIDWMNDLAKTNPNKMDEIIKKIEIAYHYSGYVTKLNSKSLNSYNKDALEVWKNFFLPRF